MKKINDWCFFKTAVKKQDLSYTKQAFIRKSHSLDVYFITTVFGVNTRKVITNHDTALYDERTLEQFCKEFQFYVRISRSVVVNILQINSYSDGMNFIWINNTRLTVSRIYKPHLQKHLKSYL